MNWAAYALLGALAAALTAILAKVGVASVPSNLAVLVRTIVVLVMVLGLVAVRGDMAGLKDIKRTAWVALLLSGFATGVSWLAYFKALQLAPASRVAPLDKVSLPITVILAALLLGEQLTWRAGLGVGLMVIGALMVTKA